MSKPPSESPFDIIFSQMKDQHAGPWPSAGFAAPRAASPVASPAADTSFRGGVPRADREAPYGRKAHGQSPRARVHFIPTEKPPSAKQLAFLRDIVMLLTTEIPNRDDMLAYEAMNARQAHDEVVPLKVV